MFSKTNDELNLDEVADFIESQNYNEKELENGINKILIILNKNPAAIIPIISNHQFMPAIYLLEELAVKMKKQNCLGKLDVLFDKCLDDLVEACIYNVHDLKRCTEAIPDYTDQVIKSILAKEDHIKRVLEADKNPEETLNEIIKKYSGYEEKFSEFYHQHFKGASNLKLT